MTEDIFGIGIIVFTVFYFIILYRIIINTKIGNKDE